MKIAAGMAAVLILSALPATALALRQESFGNAPMTKQPDWADGVVDVVNLTSRVYLVEHNGNMNCFYRGDVQALNEAIRKYAAVKDGVRQLILLPGSGKTKSFDGTPVPFDWKFYAPSGMYNAAGKRTHPVMTVYINGKKPGPVKGKDIEKWLKDLDDNSFPVREKAFQELQSLGNDAKPFLREALKARPSAEARRRCESLLEKLRGFVDVTDLEIAGGITIITVDDLLAVHLKDLKDANSYVRGMAIQDLSTLAAFSDKVVPAITDMLKKDEHEWVRRVAAGGLAQAGIKAKSALPALKEGLQDPDANVRKAFQDAIDQIEKATPGQDEEIKRNLSILKEITEFKETMSRIHSASKE